MCQTATHVSVQDVDDSYSTIFYIYSFLVLVFHQDDPSDAFYIIISGSVLVTKRLETGFVHLVPGDGFGQLGIIKHTPRSATCTANGQTELVKVTAEDYNAIFKLQYQREIREKITFFKDV